MAIFKVIDRKEPDLVLMACQNRGLNASEMLRFAGPNFDQCVKNKDGSYDVYVKSHQQIPIKPKEWLVRTEDLNSEINIFIVESTSIGDYIFLGEYNPLNIPASSDKLKNLNIEAQKRLVEDYPTLRDQFAMQAMQLLDYSFDYGNMAKTCYQIADAFIKQRDIYPEVADTVEQMEKSEFGENITGGVE